MWIDVWIDDSKVSIILEMDEWMFSIKKSFEFDVKMRNKKKRFLHLLLTGWMWAIKLSTIDTDPFELHTKQY